MESALRGGGVGARRRARVTSCGVGSRAGGGWTPRPGVARLHPGWGVGVVRLEVGRIARAGGEPWA